MPDIVEIPANTKGNDYIIGDIHGEMTLLKSFIEQKLGPDDRLFLVGDLTDRGENSLGVLKLMEEHRARCAEENRPQQIFAVRGNHENLLIRYICTKLLPEDFNEKEREDARKNYFKNGGDWIEGKDIDDDVLREILRLVSPLPYVQLIGGKKPFNVVHADLNLTDEELRRRLKDEEHNFLTEAEIEYSTWARVPTNVKDIPLDNTARYVKSTLTYCGHDIMGGVRVDTNHIDLDAGSFATKYLCVMNHTQGRCEIYGENKFLDDSELRGSEVLELLLRLKQNINEYISVRRPLMRMLERLIEKSDNKKTGTFLFTNKLNQERSLLLQEASLKIHSLPLSLDTSSVIRNLLIKNIMAVKQSSKLNKNNFGEMHEKLLRLYPELPAQIVREFNRTIYGSRHPITLKEVIANVKVKHKDFSVKPGI